MLSSSTPVNSNSNAAVVLGAGADSMALAASAAVLGPLTCDECSDGGGAEHGDARDTECEFTSALGDGLGLPRGLVGPHWHIESGLLHAPE